MAKQVKTQNGKPKKKKAPRRVTSAQVWADPEVQLATGGMGSEKKAKLENRLRELLG